MKGGLVGAWQEFAVHAKWYGKVDPWQGERRWDWIGAVYASHVCQFRDKLGASAIYFRAAASPILHLTDYKLAADQSAKFQVG
jgi:hypothetical protein